MPPVNAQKLQRKVNDVKSSVKNATNTASAHASRATKSTNDFVKVVQGFVNAFSISDLEKRISGLEKSVSSLNAELQRAVSRVSDAVRTSQAQVLGHKLPTKAVPRATATTVVAPRKRGRPVGTGKKQLAAKAAATFRNVSPLTNELTSLVHVAPKPRTPTKRITRVTASSATARPGRSVAKNAKKIVRKNPVTKITKKTPQA